MGGDGAILSPLLAVARSYLKVVEGDSAGYEKSTIIQLPYAVMFDFIAIFD